MEWTRFVVESDEVDGSNFFRESTGFAKKAKDHGILFSGKYIITDRGEVAMFSPEIDHDRYNIAHPLTPLTGEAVSAGFYEIGDERVGVHGNSSTLKLSSSSEDSSFLESFLSSLT